jgi:hypothetical protein
VRDDPEVARRIALVLDDDVRTGPGGEVGPDYCLALTLAAAASAARDDGDRRAVLHQLLGGVAEPDGFVDWAHRGLAALGGGHGQVDLATVAARLSIRIDDDRRETPAPTRLSFVRDGAAICAAALTDTTVIPERRFEVDDALLTATATAMTDPDRARVSSSRSTATSPGCRGSCSPTAPMRPATSRASPARSP